MSRETKYLKQLANHNAGVRLSNARKGIVMGAKMEITDKNYHGEPVKHCKLCSDPSSGHFVVHVGTVCPIEEARAEAKHQKVMKEVWAGNWGVATRERDEARNIARKWYREAKRLEAYIERDRQQFITDMRSK